MMTMTAVVFVLCYALIALEHPIKINKSASALIAAGLIAVSDWLGSSDEHFPYAGPSVTSLASYAADAQERAVLGTQVAHHQVRISDGDLRVVPADEGIVGEVDVIALAPERDEVAARAEDDPVVTTAIVDRMVHHSIIINIQGPSWRMHESKKLNARSKKAAKEKA